MRKWTVTAACVVAAAVAGALVVALVGPGSDGKRKTAPPAPAPVAQPSAAKHVRVTVSPAVVVRGEIATVTVTGIGGPAPQVQLVGATFDLGHALPWKWLHRTPQGWQAQLPPPEFRGLYLIRVRTSTSAPPQGSNGWFLRVYAKGTLTRPLLETPEDVARSWVAGVSPDAKLAAIKRWPLPSFDHRDPQFHQVVVIAYTLAGHRGTDERLGMFVTAVRENTAGGWRLLEATAAPQ